MTKISIVVPVYMVEDYLPACLDSILAQTFKDFEVICVNDGSPDNSLAILQEYAKKDERIKVILQTNQGTAKARETGIKNASGQFLTLLDGDDTYAPDFCQKMYDAQQKFDADIVYCDYVQAEKMPNWNDFVSTKKSKCLGNVFEKWVRKKPNMGSIIWNKIYKKELFDKIEDVPPLPTAQDMACVYQLMYYAKKVVYVPEKLHFYRIRPNSAMTAPFNQRKIDGPVGFVTFLQKVFEDKPMNKRLKKYLNAHLQKVLIKFCVIEPKVRDPKNVQKWYEYTKPLLQKLKEQGVYKPTLLPIKYKIIAWNFFRK